MLNRIPDKVWDRFEQVATIVAVVGAMIAIAICVYLEMTIGF